MALTDFRDKNKSITVMKKGTDASYTFQLIEPDGSTFIPQNYSIVSEGRFSELSEAPDFTFVVSTSIVDGLRYATIFFDHTSINSYVRQSKIYWKVLATSNSDQTVRVLSYGEVWIS